MKKVLKLNEENHNLWENFVEENKNSKFYHSLKFKEFIESSYKNCKAQYYLLIDENIDAVFPFFLVKSKLFGNKLISLPFLDNGGFLGNYNIEDIKELFEEIRKIKDLDSIEIRLNNFMKNFEEDRIILLKLGFNQKNAKNQIILELKDEDILWSDFNRITRKGVKKAEKSNLELRGIDTEKELKKFYELYLKNMKNFGTPQHSYKYFLNLFKFLNEEFRGINCYRNGELIGSLIVLLSNESVYAAYNSSEGKSLIYQPNDLIHWEIIKWASKNNFKYFDIGQCEKNAEEKSRAEGIYKFKKKWSGKVYDKNYFYYNLKNKSNKDSGNNNLKKFRNIWKRLPSPILKVIGPKISSQLAI